MQKEQTFNLNSLKGSFVKNSIQKLQRQSQRPIRFFTLPKKTQPTSYSSGKMSSHKHSTTKIQYDQLQTCPQTIQKVQKSISPFQYELINKQKQKSKKNINDVYTHKLRLDYGRLQKPKYYLEKQLKKQILLSHDLSSFIQTKQFKNIRLLGQDLLQNMNIKKKDQQQLITNKKMKPIQMKSIERVNPESQKKTQVKNKILKINVRAYDYLNQTLSHNQSNQKSTNVKNNNKQFMMSANQNYNENSKKGKIGQKESNFLHNSRVSQKSSRTHTESQNSQRKILHSRIVKMVNPSSGMQTKIISYPDLSDLKRLKRAL